jgi:hypothetical protein
MAPQVNAQIYRICRKMEVAMVHRSREPPRGGTEDRPAQDGKSKPEELKRDSKDSGLQR